MKFARIRLSLWTKQKHKLFMLESKDSQHTTYNLTFKTITFGETFLFWILQQQIVT